METPPAQTAQPNLAVEVYEMEYFIKRLDVIIRDSGLITMDDYRSALEAARLDAATVDMSYHH